ncbi:hypothetical protein, partial [Hyphomonas sp.]|uniref:hypothetical protein n=1 Tax=Hyphomonas sp. TaxID=87 RepID=UPI0025B9B931
PGNRRHVLAFPKSRIQPKSPGQRPLRPAKSAGLDGRQVCSFKRLTFLEILVEGKRLKRRGWG